MARQPESQLYQELISSEFAFIERGIRSIAEIYAAVKKQYPHLCDESYLCIVNCTNGNNQPEWNHRVRSALSQLKSDDGPIRFTGRRGYWDFR